MDLKAINGYLLAKAFKFAVGVVLDEKGLKAKEVAATIGIEEAAFSKLKNGKQTIEALHIEKMEASFPGFKSYMESYIENRTQAIEVKRTDVSADMSADLTFLKGQLKLWQMMYFQKMDIPEQDRDDFIKEITGM